MLRTKNPAYDKSYAFALRIVEVCDQLNDQKRQHVLSNQLLRSGTSIGANLAEAHASMSHADLCAKISIAYKECQETKYWLNLLRDSRRLDAATADGLLDAANEISKILFSSMRTLRGEKRE